MTLLRRSLLFTSESLQDVKKNHVARSRQKKEVDQRTQ